MRAAPPHRRVEAVTAGRRVVIAEDSVLLLAGLTKLLEGAGFEVAATAADAAGLLTAVEREQPDVVIADLYRPCQEQLSSLRRGSRRSYKNGLTRVKAG